MRLEDWLLIGLLGAVVLISLSLKAAQFWMRYQLLKTKLDTATNNLRTGYKVTRHFTGIIADTEMTGKRQTITVTAEYAAAMYKIEEHLRETLEMLESKQ